MGNENYVLAPGFAGVQFWNKDRSDLVEVRRTPGQAVVEIPSSITDEELERLLDYKAVVKASAASAPLPEMVIVDEPAGNASRDEWAKYADSVGLTVEPGFGRDEIKGLVAESRA